LRTVPPTPTSRGPLWARRGLDLARDVLAQRLDLLALGALRVRQEALGHADRAEPPRAGVHRLAVLDPRELHRSAAEVEHDALRERGRVDRGQVAVVRLGPAREHLDLEARPLAREREELGLVGRVADRRRRDRADLLDSRRSAEVRVQLERLERALHRLGLQRARRLQAFADAHGLVDLVRALPPRVGGCEDHQPERVRPAVDDRQSRLAGHS
jgi:hypothetical protein